MYYIKVYAIVKAVEDISIVEELDDEKYWELYDRNKASIEKSCYTKEEADYLWNKMKYCVTDFDGDYIDNKPVIIIKMYALYNENVMKKWSKGNLCYSDIVLWFPELAD